MKFIYNGANDKLRGKLVTATLIENEGLGELYKITFKDGRTNKCLAEYLLPCFTTYYNKL